MAHLRRQGSSNSLLLVSIIVILQHTLRHLSIHPHCIRPTRTPRRPFPNPRTPLIQYNAHSLILRRCTLLDSFFVAFQRKRRTIGTSVLIELRHGEQYMTFEACSELSICCRYKRLLSLLLLCGCVVVVDVRVLIGHYFCE